MFKSCCGIFLFRNLLALHRIATLRHDELGQVCVLLMEKIFFMLGIMILYLPVDVFQETLLNLLLRNYLHYNLYDQAEKLRSKAPRFEAHSNQQVCWFYHHEHKTNSFKIHTFYSSAHSCGDKTLVMKLIDFFVLFGIYSDLLLNFLLLILTPFICAHLFCCIFLSVLSLSLLPRENPDYSIGVYRCKRVSPASCS